jgi:uncharacterized protein (DUF1810 family)
MDDPFQLERFLTAQADLYATALRELQRGRKTSHWIWFIFPQIAGLGRSPTAQHYAIGSLDEARAYLQHPILGTRLHQCLDALNALPETDVERVFGDLDAMKFRSAHTLFQAAAHGDAIITTALERWFGGKEDAATLTLLRRA